MLGPHSTACGVNSEIWRHGHADPGRGIGTCPRSGRGYHTPTVENRGLEAAGGAACSRASKERKAGRHRRTPKAGQPGARVTEERGRGKQGDTGRVPCVTQAREIGRHTWHEAMRLRQEEKRRGRRGKEESERTGWCGRGREERGTPEGGGGWRTAHTTQTDWRRHTHKPV